MISSLDMNKIGFVDRYSYTGTRYYTSFCAIPDGLNFIDQVGGLERIKEYNKHLSQTIAKRLACVWNTSLLVTENMTCNAMSNVILPSRDLKKIRHMQQSLDHNHNIYINCGTLDGTDIHYVRISSQIYLELDDFKPLETLVPELLK